MEIDAEALEEFKRLYLKEYGISLPNIEAIELGNRLIRFVKAIYGNNLPTKFDKRFRKENNRIELK